ncbi:MAG TPA: hypothetical protein VKX41_02875 [Alloacidobacterium sp.]|nr:hypothetical protein [Alloacidobacterium sp.]
MVVAFGRNFSDVLIVGGGPAGLALRMQGADVLVVDALRPPIDKACGEGLMPDAHRDLAALGLYCEPNDGVLIRWKKNVYRTFGIAAGDPVALAHPRPISKEHPRDANAPRGRFSTFCGSHKEVVKP